MLYGNVIDNSAASLVFCMELEGRKSALIRRGVCIMCVTKEPAVHVERRATHVCMPKAGDASFANCHDVFQGAGGSGGNKDLIKKTSFL